MTGRRGAGICAIGAIDMAIWYLYGKGTGKPVWRLLGGVPQPHVTPYASLLPTGTTLAEYRESLLAKATWAREFGFSAAKLEICIKGPYTHNRLQEGDDAIVQLVAESRQAVGPEMRIMVDVAYCWSDWKEALRVLRRLEQYDIFFVETPLPSDDLEGYRRLANATDIRIAAGEWLQTRYEFLDLMDRGQVDVVQPDVGRVGGFTEALRVVQLAQYRGKIVVPHCWKNGIGAAATAHLAAVSPNCRFIEFLPAAVPNPGFVASWCPTSCRLSKAGCSSLGIQGWGSVSILKLFPGLRLPRRGFIHRGRFPKKHDSMRILPT